MSWYVGRSCALCGKEFRRTVWFRNAPALLAPDGKTVDPASLGRRGVEELLSTHTPVCWEHHLERVFRRARERTETATVRRNPKEVPAGTRSSDHAR